MAAWRERYHYRGHVWAHAPEKVFEGRGSAGIIAIGTIFILIDSVTSGSVAAIKPNMTVVLGTSAGASDLGRTRVHYTYDSAGDDYIAVWASPNLHDGEMAGLGADDYITVYDERRMWFKPPYANDSGDYYYSYTSEESFSAIPQGMTFEQKPIANGGVGVANFFDETTRLITESFSAADSLAIADDAVLGAYTAGIFSGGETLTDLDFTNNSNAIDGNPATYATGQADFDANQDYSWLRYDLGDGNDAAIRKFDLTGDATYAAKVFMLQWSDNDTDYVTAFHGYETGWGSTESRTFYVHHVGVHRYWRLIFFENNGAASGELRVNEMQWYAEDRTSGASPWAWDVGDGTITVGSTTTQDITATFKPGFRYVELGVTDTNGEEGLTDIPVLSAKNPNTAEIDSSTPILYTGASFSASSEDLPTYPASNAFNGLSTYWRTVNGVLAGTITVQFPTGEFVSTYDIEVIAPSEAPKDWTVEGSNNGIAWTTIDTRTGIIFAPVSTQSFTLNSPTYLSYTYYRINVTLNGGSLAHLAIRNIYYYDGIPQTATVIEGARVTGQEYEIAGQAIEIEINEPLPTSTYPDGTFIMYWEDEYYDNVKGSLASAGPSGREHMKFQGWIDEEPTSIEPTDRTLLRTTRLRCLDAGRRLAQIAGVPIMAVKDAVPTEGYYMKHANIDTLIYLLIRWLTTAAEITDYIPSFTADHYNFGLLAADGQSIYETIQQKALAIDFNFVCTKSNELKVVYDLLSAPSRFTSGASTAETLTAADYGPIDYTRQYTSRINWVEGSGVWALAMDADHGSFTVDTVFTIMPGDIPGHGVGTGSDNEQVSSYPYPDNEAAPAGGKDFDIHERNGRSFAQLASALTPLTLDIIHAGDTGLDPAAPEWVNMTIPSDVAAQRGLTLTDAPGVIRRMRIDHDHENMTKRPVAEWERQEEYIAAWGYEP